MKFDQDRGGDPADRKSANTVISVAASSGMFVTCGNCRPGTPATTFSRVRMSSPAARTKMVRMAVATITAFPSRAAPCPD